MKFYEAYLQGATSKAEILDYIMEWHESDSKEEVYEYLGITLDQYIWWLEEDEILIV